MKRQSAAQYTWLVALAVLIGIVCLTWALMSRASRTDTDNDRHNSPAASASPAAADGVKIASHAPTPAIAAAPEKPAGAKANKPQEPLPSQAEVDELFVLLNAKDVKSMHKASGTLCRLMKTHPELKLEAKVLAEARRLMSSTDPDRAIVGMHMVPSLKDTSCAQDILDAWERHEKVEFFKDMSIFPLVSLLQVQLSAELTKEHPDWPAEKVSEQGRLQSFPIIGKLSSDRSKWREYWAGKQVIPPATP